MFKSLINKIRYYFFVKPYIKQSHSLIIDIQKNEILNQPSESFKKGGFPTKIIGRDCNIIIPKSSFNNNGHSINPSVNLIIGDKL